MRNVYGMMWKEILIVGFGVVGKAVHDGIKGSHLCDIMDPPLGWYNDDYTKYDGIILCVPTPETDDGQCDVSLVKKYLGDIRRVSNTVPILLKSTTTIDAIPDDDYLTVNPEFLTEANSSKDFKNQKFAFFGGDPELSDMWYNVITKGDVTIDKVMFTTRKNAMLAKYVINTFLATKISYFNDLYNMIGSDFDEVVRLASQDERLGNSHMQVPGPDGKLGFGGMCFPKDTKAFIAYANDNGKSLPVLEAAVECNKNQRMKKL